MKKTFRASMTWLHTWCGLLLGWLLFAIFVTGTATYYRAEISQWMKPELAPSPASTADILARAEAELRRIAPDAVSYYVVLPDARNPGLHMTWETDAGRDKKSVDAGTGKIEARDTRAGEFFYRFHFQLQLPYPWGRWIACFAALFMMVALVTGIVAHRQFFKDFFTFRSSKPGNRSWLDFHNLAGVLALPFYFMISYTALIMFIYMFAPAPRLALPEPSAPEVAAVVADSSAPIGRASWVPMAAQAEKIWGDRSLRYVYASELGTPAGNVNLGPSNGGAVTIGGESELDFNASTGELVSKEPTPRGIVSKTHDVLYALHLARFANGFLRGLFFFLGTLGAVLVATGLVLWTVKRRKRQEALHGEGRYGFGHWLVEKLNVAVIAGFPLSLASIFWANRLLPIGLADRGDREVNVVFVVWGLAVVHALLRPVFKAWREQLWAGAALFLLLPLLDAARGPWLFNAFREGHSAYLGFLLLNFAIGLVLSGAALKVGRKRPSHASRARSGASA